MTDSKIGIIGAGRLGTALARAFTKAGYEVSIINSKGADSLALQLQILLPGVAARNVDDLMVWADVIVLAVPLPRFKQLPLAAMNGKIVIDAMNYWSPFMANSLSLMPTQGHRANWSPSTSPAHRS